MKEKHCNIKFLAALSLLGAMLCLSSCGSPKDSPKETDLPKDTEEPTATAEPTPEPTPEPVKGFDLHFIDVGTGDCMLLVCDGEAMIIDSGNVGHGEGVVNYVKSQGVTALKYLTVTHGHADHVGGMPEIMEAFPFETMFLYDVPCSEKPYKDLLQIIADRNLAPVNPEIGFEYHLGGGTFTFIAPFKFDPSNLNNNSLCIRFVYGEKVFLLLGDIQSGVENQLLKADVDLKADLWKADHHASSAGCGKKFIQAIAPEFICIQVGTENKLGYPDKGTVKRLTDSGAAVYRNDLNGTVVFHCDGKTITAEPERTGE